MRPLVRDFVALVARELELSGPIYEFGALQVPGQGDAADLRPLFPGREYVGCDMREGPGVDRVLNLHALDLPDASVGSVLSLDTLEHVEYPRKAMREMHRVLQPGGVIAISSVMNFPIHAYPDDYWRFTPAAFRSLLEDFDACAVAGAGAEDFPHSVVGIGVKSGPAAVDRLDVALAEWSARWQVARPPGTARSRKGSLERLLLPWTPPAILHAYQRLRARTRQP